jgi:hypothetical protein
MPRFYFHLYNDEITLDEEGRDLPDAQAAREAAEEDARYMASESVRGGKLNLANYVEVTGTDGQPALRVAFGDVVEISDQAPQSDVRP